MQKSPIAYMYVFLAFALFLFPCSAIAAKLAGTVYDSQGESLVGALVKVDDGKYAALTGPDGSFSFELIDGTHSISAEFMGCEKYDKRLNLSSDKHIKITLHEMATDLDEVVVSATATREKLKEVQIGVEKVAIAELAKTPSFLGENDIMKSIQTLPGVNAESEGASGFQVRGGTSAQNLVLLDNATIYNAGHLLGFFSAFNDNILANANLYKGLIPAYFGGATSSVLDIYTRIPNMHRYHGSVSVGLLSAKASVEGPIVKDKLSFGVAARRSYLDLFLKMTDDYKNNVLNFYDINARVDWKASSKDRVSLSFIYTRDNMGLVDLMDLECSNLAWTLDWRRTINEHWRNALTASMTYYDSNTGAKIFDNKYDMGSFIHEYKLRESAVLQTSHHTARAGAEIKLYGVESADWTINLLKQREKRNAFEASAWLADDWSLAKKLDLSAGLRFVVFGVLGGSPYYDLDEDMNILKTYNPSLAELVETYFSVEPRVSLNYKVLDNLSLKAGYSLTTQNLQAIRNAGTTMPIDRYVMTSNIVEPQKAHQVSAGGILSLKDGGWEISAEGYYKEIENVYDYVDGKFFFSEIEMERIIRGGRGRSYGMELLLKKSYGKLTGWLGYTLSWSQNKINGINNGKWYYASNDRRHDLSIVLMYDLPRHWDISALWMFNTGQAYSAPSAKYTIGGETFYYYSERNGYRMNDYHRLDISVSHRKRTKHFVERVWSFGFYNIYARYNPYMITFEDDKNSPTGTKATQVSLFTIVPSVSFSIKF